MNYIKSFFAFFVLAIVIATTTFTTQAQTVAVPQGTSSSVRYLGQTYIEIGDYIKSTGNLNDMAVVAEKIATKYEDKVDLNAAINSSERSYIAKCIMYNFEQTLRSSFKQQGLNPDSPEAATYLNQAMGDISKQVDKKLVGAKTVGEAVKIIENIFD